MCSSRLRCHPGYDPTRRNGVCHQFCNAWSVCRRRKIFAKRLLTLKTAQTGGIALGLSLSGAVFVNRAVAGLTSVLPDVPRSQLQLAVSGTSGSYFKSLPHDKQVLAIEVIVQALSKVFILVYVGGAVTLLCSLLFTVSIYHLQLSCKMSPQKPFAYLPIIRKESYKN